MLWFSITLITMLVWLVPAFRALSDLEKNPMEHNKNVVEEAIGQDAGIPIREGEKEADSHDNMTATRECPFCCEPIKARATRCPHCGESLGQHLHSQVRRPLNWQEFGQAQRRSYLEWLFYLAEWLLESLVLRVKQMAFFEFLDYVSRVSVLIAVIFWFSESGERERQRQIQAWQVVSIGEQIGGGIATTQALELLNCTDSFWWCKKVSLEGIKLENVDLPDLDLSGGTLVNAVLTGANLRWANLSNTYLYSSDLGKANLRSCLKR